MSTIEELNPGLKDLGRYEYGWADSDTAGASARRGLNEDGWQSSKREWNQRVEQEQEAG